MYWNLQLRNVTVWYQKAHSDLSTTQSTGVIKTVTAYVAAEFSRRKRSFERSETGPFICPSQAIQSSILSSGQLKERDVSVFSGWKNWRSWSLKPLMWSVQLQWTMYLIKGKSWSGNYGWYLPYILFINWNWAERRPQALEK